MATAAPSESFGSSSPSESPIVGTPLWAYHGGGHRLDESFSLETWQPSKRGCKGLAVAQPPSQQQQPPSASQQPQERHSPILQQEVHNMRPGQKDIGK